MRDVIRVVRTLLAGRQAAATRAPRTPQLPPLRAGDEAAARRSIPIYVAALKQKAIESIGELADGWIPTFWPYERLAEGRAWIAAGAARAGRDPSTIVTAPVHHRAPARRCEAGAMMAKQIIAFYIGGMGDYYIELLTPLRLRRRLQEDRRPLPGQGDARAGGRRRAATR